MLMRGPTRTMKEILQPRQRNNAVFGRELARSSLRLDDLCTDPVDATDYLVLRIEAGEENDGKWFFRVAVLRGVDTVGRLRVCPCRLGRNCRLGGECSAI